MPVRKVLYVFGQLTDQDVEWITANGVIRELGAGDLLVQEGVANNELTFVLEGEFQVTVPSLGGDEVARVGVGEVVGELSFIDSRPPSASVRARMPSRVLSLSRSILEKRMQKDVPFAFRLHRAIAVFMADRLRDTTLRMAKMSGRVPAAYEQRESELSIEVLDNLAQAGARFERMLKHLSGR